MFWLHTLHLDMVDQPDVPELDPYVQDLYVAVNNAVPAWISSRVSEIASSSCDVRSVEFTSALADVVEKTFQEVSKNLFSLLATDVDAQQSQMLQGLRVPEAQRDEYEVRAMPDDVFAIGPLTWRDLGEEVHEAGISWGAWKAATILTRRRADGSIPS